MPDDFDERISRALASDVPQVYFNGFVTQIGTGDIVVIAERNGAPVATFNVSYTVAKTLALSLGGAVAQIEERAKREILTTSDIQKMFETEPKQ